MAEYRAARCSYPPELDEVTLIAAADGDSSAEVFAHLAACAACAARASAIDELQQRLRERLYRLFCPTSDELATFLAGHTVPAVRQTTADHLDTCPRCRSELALLQEITAVSPARPASTLRRVVAYPQHPDQSRSPSLVTEHNFYRAGMLRIMLNIECQRGMALPRLRGSLRGNQQPGLTASLLSYGRVVSCTTLDEQGAFTLVDLAPGNFSLSLRLPDYEVVVEAVQIG